MSASSAAPDTPVDDDRAGYIYNDDDGGDNGNDNYSYNSYECFPSLAMVRGCLTCRYRADRGLFRLPCRTCIGSGAWEPAEKP